MQFHHPPNFPWILAATPGSQNTTGCSVLSWFSFLYGFWRLLAWVSSGCPDLSSTEVDTCTGEMSLLFPSSLFSNLNFTYCRWRRWGWRRWWGMTLLFYRCPWGWWRGRGRTWQAWNHNRNEILRIENSVFNEMWFLTIDPFVGISVFIAKLSKRQYCWRVFEDFNSRIYTILWHTPLPLHAFALLSPLATARFRQSIHFSITQVLFAGHMHWHSGVDNKFSFLRF